MSCHRFGEDGLRCVDCKGSKADLVRNFACVRSECGSDDQRKLTVILRFSYGWVQTAHVYANGKTTLRLPVRGWLKGLHWIDVPDDHDMLLSMVVRGDELMVAPLPLMALPTSYPAEFPVPIVDADEEFYFVMGPEPMYRVVNTCNFGKDYPDEKFVGEPMSHGEALKTARELNGQGGPDAMRYHKVVLEGYTLQPGFEP